jgi:hypothetical protein
MREKLAERSTASRSAQARLDELARNAKVSERELNEQLRLTQQAADDLLRCAGTYFALETRALDLGIIKQRYQNNLQNSDSACQIVVN